MPDIDNQELTSKELDAQKSIIAGAIAGYVFEACQPGRGDVFGFIDDIKMGLASYVLKKISSEQAKQLTETQQALDRAVEALEEIMELQKNNIDTEWEIAKAALTSIKE